MSAASDGSPDFLRSPGSSGASGPEGSEGSAEHDGTAGFEKHDGTAGSEERHGTAGSVGSVGSAVPWVPADLDLAERPGIPASKIVLGALSLVLVLVVLIWALPWATGASWAQIFGTLAGAPVWAVPAVTLLGAAALVLETVTVRTAVTGSRYSSALLGHTASAGLGLALPGGSVLGLGLMGWILRRAGLTIPVILTGIIAASLVEMVTTSILVPLLGLGAYAVSSTLGITGLSLPGALWAALIAVLGAMVALALLVVVLRRGSLAGILGRLDGLVPAHVAAGILTQRNALVEMLRQRPLMLLLPTLAARALQWTALLLAIHAVGADVPLLLTVAVFALGRVISLVPITPGGAGIAETVGAAALVALGVGAADAAAAMLLMLVTTLVVPLVAGAVSTAIAFTLPAVPRRGA